MSEKKVEVHVCDEEGCTSTDVMPVYREAFDEPDGFYCDKHIAQAGFCKGCGQFSAGSESFDFSPIAGYCSECTSQILAEEEAEDEFNDDEDDMDDLPFDDDSELDWDDDEDEQ